MDLEMKEERGGRSLYRNWVFFGLSCLSSIISVANWVVRARVKSSVMGVDGASPVFEGSTSTPIVLLAGAG